MYGGKKPITYQSISGLRNQTTYNPTEDPQKVPTLMIMIDLINKCDGYP